jgi:murein DD-endopeptidase MepM/ murein hydrolase activator NlpD
VKEGEQVKKGQVIAFSGSTGHSTGNHLHFEVRYQNIFLNPEHYIQIPLDSNLAQVKNN